MQNFDLSKFHYVHTVVMFYRAFKNTQELIEYYKKFQFVFDFEKVEKYLNEKLPNLPLFLKIMKMDYPKNSGDLALFIQKIFDLSFEDFSTSSRDVEPLIEQYPELLKYIDNRFKNKIYETTKEGYFIEPACSCIFNVNRLSERSKKLFCMSWLADECIYGILNMDYRKFLDECLISDKMDEVMSA